MTSIEIYEVGGSIRDEVLGRENKDRDFAFELTSWALAAEDGYAFMKGYLEHEGYTIFVESPEFFTIRAHFPKGHAAYGQVTADFVLCRKEGAYTDGRRPDTVEIGTIYDDLARRDFTCNAMARRLSDGVLLDPHNGREDLLASSLRAVGLAEDRLREDALRALRALRFSVTRNLTLSWPLYDAIYSDWLPALLTSVSAERKREELHKMFRHDSQRAMALFAGPRARDLNQVVFSDGLWLRPTLEKR